MGVKIKFSKYKYTREETNNIGLLVSRKEYENKYLPGVMEHLANSAEPERSEVLLDNLRKAYKLFKPKSIEFSKK